MIEPVPSAKQGLEDMLTDYLKDPISNQHKKKEIIQEWKQLLASYIEKTPYGMLP